MKIPSHAVFDVRIGGEIDKFFWSFAVQNLFDRKYFDYGLDASFTFLGTHLQYLQSVSAARAAPSCEGGNEVLTAD